MGVNTIPGLGVVVEYATDGVTFRKIPYGATFSTSGGEPTVIEGDTFDGPFKRVGELRVPDATIEFPSYVPNHASWVALQAEAMNNNAPVTYRISTLEEEFYAASGAANTVAIDTAGAVTFAGTAPDFTGDDFAVGMVVQIGTDEYTIDTISSTGAVVVKPAPATAIVATVDYKILNPSLQKQFPARFRTPVHDNLEAAGVLSSTLELALSGQLPEWSIAS